MSSAKIHPSMKAILGYSLVELAMVLMVMGMMTGAALKMSTNKADTAQTVDMYARLDAIDKALLAYRKAYNRLPCPARINIAIEETTTPRFGVADTSNLGTCTATTMMTADDETVAGGVPVRTLGLPDTFAFDPWGRKIEYYVDRRMTLADAFDLYKPSNPSIGDICIKYTVGGTNNCATDTANVYRTKKAVVALVGHGKNGHGGYQRVPAARLDTSSVNAAELENCGATTSGTCSGNNRTLIMQDRTDNASNANDTYDDYVLYRMRWHYLSAGDLQVEGDVINTSLFPADIAFTHETQFPYIFLYRMIGNGAFQQISLSQPIPSSGRGVEFSQDNEYMAVSFDTAPFLYVYKRTGGTYIKLPDSNISGTIPFKPTKNLKFSPDGKYLAVALEVDATSLKGIYIFKRSGDNFQLLTSQPLTNAYNAVSWGRIYGLEWSRDSRFLFTACAGSCAASLRAYSVDNATDTFTSVATNSASQGLGLAISPDSQHMVINENTGNAKIFSFDGTNFNFITTLTGGGGAYGAKYSYNGVYLALTGFSSAQALRVFKRSGSTYTDLGYFATNRWGNGIISNGFGSGTVSWSMDDKYIAVSGASSSGTTSQVFVYKREVDQFSPIAGASEFPGAPSVPNGNSYSISYTKPKLCSNCILAVMPPASKMYGLNENMDWTVVFDQPMNVTGTPYIPLIVGGDTCRADYVSGSGTNIFTFRLRYPSNRSAVVDAYAAANLGAPWHDNPQGNGVWKNVTTWGHWETGSIRDKQFPCHLEWTGWKPTNGDGSVNWDGTHMQAMDHPYMIADNDTDGVETKTPLVMQTENGPNQTQPTTAYIKNVANNTDVRNIYVQPDSSGVLVDLTPAAIGNMKVPQNDTYREGETLDFYAIFNENVYVTGTPRLPVVIGATTVYANYVSGSSSGSLKFSYTITAADVDTDGIQLTPLSLELNGGTIKDSANNPAGLTFPAPTTTGVLVNGASPGIVSFTGPAPGSYITGQNLDFQVTYSSDVQDYAGSYLNLTINGISRTANYLSKAGNVLTYRYTIIAADSSYNGFILTPTITNGGTPMCKNPCMGATTYADLTFNPPAFSSVYINPAWGTINGYTVGTFMATDNNLLLSTIVGAVGSNNYSTSGVGGGGYIDMGGKVRSVDVTKDGMTMAVAIDTPPYIRIIVNSTANRATAGYNPTAPGTGTELTGLPTLPGAATMVRFSPDNGQYLLIGHESTTNNMTMWKRVGGPGTTYAQIPYGSPANSGVNYNASLGRPNVMEWSPDGQKVVFGYDGNYYSNILVLNLYKNWWESEYYLVGMEDYYIDPNAINTNLAGYLFGCARYNWAAAAYPMGDRCLNADGTVPGSTWGAKEPSKPVTAAAWTKDSKFLLVGQRGSPNVISFKRVGYNLWRDGDLLLLPSNPEIRSIDITDDDRYVIVAISRYPYLYMLKRVGDTFEKLPDIASADAANGTPIQAKWNGRIGNNYSILMGLESIPFYKVNRRVGDVIDSTGSLGTNFPMSPIRDIKQRIVP